MIAIDLGSNTIRALVFDCVTQELIDSMEATVRTAQGMHESKMISSKAVMRITLAIAQMRERFDFDKHTVVAKTTAALRQARNQSEVLAAIYKSCGIRFDVIDAQTEAFYSHLAVEYRLKCMRQSFSDYFILDVGGGSTELIYIDNQKTMHSLSVNMGILTLSEAYENYDEGFLAALHEEYRAFDDFIQRIQASRDALLVATSGTPTTVASMMHDLTVETYDTQIINGTKLTHDDLSTQLTRLLAMSEDERIRYVGVARDTLIIVGIQILHVLFEKLSVKHAFVIDDGVREGIALDFCQKQVR